MILPRKNSMDAYRFDLILDTYREVFKKGIHKKETLEELHVHVKRNYPASDIEKEDIPWVLIRNELKYELEELWAKYHMEKLVGINSYLIEAREQLMSLYRLELSQKNPPDKVDLLSIGVGILEDHVGLNPLEAYRIAEKEYAKAEVMFLVLPDK